jgi:hypothetical protein
LRCTTLQDCWTEGVLTATADSLCSCDRQGSGIPEIKSTLNGNHLPRVIR